MKKECRIIAMIIMLVFSAVTIMAGTTDQVVNPSDDLSIILSGSDTQPMAEGVIYEMVDHQYDGLLSLQHEMTLAQLLKASGEDMDITHQVIYFSPFDQLSAYREAADQQEIPPVSKAEYESYVILGGYRAIPEPVKPETVPRL